MLKLTTDARHYHASKMAPLKLYWGSGSEIPNLISDMLFTLAVAVSQLRRLETDGAAATLSRRTFKAVTKILQAHPHGGCKYVLRRRD